MKENWGKITSDEWEEIVHFEVPTREIECDRCGKVICENHYYGHLNCEVSHIKYELWKDENLNSETEYTLCADCTILIGGTVKLRIESNEGGKIDR